MNTRRLSSLNKCGILLFMAAVSAGCGSSDADGPPMGQVTGKVTYQEKPVVGANIVFLPTTRETPAGAAVTDSAGKYTLSISGHQQGAVTGSYQVSITLHAPYDGPVKEGENPEYAKEIYRGKSLIPEKYGSPTTSKLTADVEPGRNTFDFALQD
ncbi:MAG: carboxypeptidase regulatory-like protein [Planctomycetaceae bacterium]|nr:carboxypeptidase regulatory-like protein [Planctomycetaceae bacterium]